VGASAVELFRTRSIDLQPDAEHDSAVEYAAVIGFSAEKVRGMVGIGVDPATLSGLVAADTQAVPEVNSEDWLAESANQLVGRLKNKLMGHGMTVSLALPTVLSGVRLQFLSQEATSLCTHKFKSPAGTVYVWLDVRIDADRVLTPTHDPGMQGTPEGAVVLF
jgi:CheY-specific phosphatase CheX